MIRRLLVANRGEIARRVFATCRRLGIETIAVHSDADAGLPFVREADAAYRLPGNAPADTYLRGDLIIEAARRTGADAIHPGYGFLSENAGFARAVEAAGLTWVGPDPESIERMGSKVEAKKLMEAAGVPVLGNLTPALRDGSYLTSSGTEVTEADLPLLVKASAGGGGRGMRIVRALADLPTEVEKASAEAESAFGDGTVFVEPYVEAGRHVEVQVVGDGAGGVLVLGERDCSIQRRHQKVVEESPAPDLDRAVAAQMHEAARAAAAAIDYRGAGTVEFLYDPATERFFFLEMNTRLQVEHPVTEAVFGVDLVELQLRVAEGGAPVVEEGALRPSRNYEPRGHAIEVRLYAEDPAGDWQPQSGLLTAFDVPGVDVELGGLATHGLRLDAGFETGSEVSTHYDAMLAKVIAWAPSRREAARRLATALAKARLHGLVTNRDLLVAILRDQAFLDGRVSTAFLDAFDLDHARTDVHTEAVAAAIALAERTAATRTVQHGIPVAWRNVVSQPQVARFAHGDEEVEAVWLCGRDGYAVDGITVVGVVAAGSADEWRVTLEIGGITASYDVAVRGRAVDVDGPLGHVRLDAVPRFTDPAEQLAAGSLLAPMPGTVVSVAVAAGDAVRAGQQVLVLEAMKMQHTITAPTDGVATEIPVRAGEQVAAGAVLAVVEPEAVVDEEGDQA